MWKLTTGEPCAGEPPARFGGRGGESLPYPYGATMRRRKSGPIAGAEGVRLRERRAPRLNDEINAC